MVGLGLRGYFRTERIVAEVMANTITLIILEEPMTTEG